MTLITKVVDIPHYNVIIGSVNANETLARLVIESMVNTRVKIFKKI